MLRRTASILLAEDNDDDAFITQRTIARSGIEATVHRVNNGVECLDYLRSDEPYPDLVLLDINMPMMDGREVLQEITTDENLKHLPVVVLSTSMCEREIAELHQMRCNSYLVKTLKFERFQEMLTSLCRYWFDVVELPVASAAAGAGKSISSPMNNG
ncbi:MAG TPA: response regulator [Planctomycetaceae bacterium]|nr:response regulator [Planctomycetaceae bacterium]